MYLQSNENTKRNAASSAKDKLTWACLRGLEKIDESTSAINNKGVTKFWNCFMKLSWKLPWSLVLDSSGEHHEYESNELRSE